MVLQSAGESETANSCKNCCSLGFLVCSLSSPLYLSSCLPVIPVATLMKETFFSVAAFFRLHRNFDEYPVLNVRYFSRLVAWTSKLVAPRRRVLRRRNCWARSANLRAQRHEGEEPTLSGCVVR